MPRRSGIRFPPARLRPLALHPRPQAGSPHRHAELGGLGMLHRFLAVDAITIPKPGSTVVPRWMA
jgi:hypothetical protein